MKKYITLENKIYESYLVIDLDKINDEILPVSRKTGGGADKNQFFIQQQYFDVFKTFFPLVYKDREDKTTGKNKARIKNYFNISSLFNDLDFVNKQIMEKYSGDGLINKDQYFEGLISLSKIQNLNTTIFIESEIANAQNGIGFKNWGENFRNFIKIILLPTTQLKVYLFRDGDNVNAYWEFKQDFVEGLSNIPIENTTSDPKNIIYYGAPGTGKSYRITQDLKEVDTIFQKRITFHPEYDNTSFVGGYKPITDKNGDVKYEFVPQIFTNIYVEACNDPAHQYYLIIEEINRGNCAEIFGELFQLLDRDENYKITPSDELINYLNNNISNSKFYFDGQMLLPDNLSILATMNTSDQSLFPMDSAFKRRWEWEYIPICYTVKDDFGNINTSFDFEIDIEDGQKYSWIKFIEKINLNHIKENQSLGMDKCIGNYFIKPDNGKTISLRPFINKVIFYLWNDVFKDEDNKVFEEKTSYEDFFPIETKGKMKIKELFERIELSPIKSSPLEIVEEEAPVRNVAEDREEIGS